MIEKSQNALVVEGGAMRGIFAAGVLDSFLDLAFNPYSICYGVSAGSTNLAGYLCHQRGRSHKVITDYSCRPEFFNLKKYLTGGHYIDIDWLWDIAGKEYPLDAATYAQQDVDFKVVTTNIDTGCAEYHQPNEQNLSDILLASCSVPFAYRGFPEINGHGQTDGGVADSIPVIEAYNQGARHITVILSQQNGYRKQKSKLAGLIKLALRHKPALANAMQNRYVMYNQTMDFIDHPPADCNLKVIAPGAGFSVTRTTTNSKTLNLGYAMGIEAGKQFISGYAINGFKNAQNRKQKA